MAVDPTITKDRREDILAYLVLLLASVDGIKGAYRDRGGLTEETSLPAVLVLDGKETPVTEISPGRSVQMPAGIYRLAPQIFVQLQPRYDDNNNTLNDPGGGAPIAAPIGPELSAYRVKVIKKLAADVNLAAMLGSNGKVRYLGSETDMQAQAPMQGQIRLDFEFDFVLDPNNL